MRNGVEMSIRGFCRTNLDGYEREEWPRRFVAVPRKGERIAATSGRNLVVVSVTHHVAASKLGMVIAGELCEGEPYIEIELHRG
jgi:hypothetical protein